MAKTCTSCKVTKELTEFHKASRYKDGRRQKCKECRKANNYGNNPEYKKQWYEDNKNRIRENRQEYYQNNADQMKSRVKSRYLKIKHTESHKKYKRYAASLRRSRLLNRTPGWADLNKIQEIYNNCPEGYHVDHIIPLAGKNVSGLHVEDNLQYLTPEENFSKNNKYEVL